MCECISSGSINTFASLEKMVFYLFSLLKDVGVFLFSFLKQDLLLKIVLE